MHANTSRFDNPELSIDRAIGENGHEFLHSCNDRSRRQPPTAFANDNAGSGFRAETKHVAKVVVERDQRAMLMAADLVKVVVRDAGEACWSAVATSWPARVSRSRPSGPRFSSSLNFKRLLGWEPG